MVLVAVVRPAVRQHGQEGRPQILRRAECVAHEEGGQVAQRPRQDGEVVPAAAAVVRGGFGVLLR